MFSEASEQGPNNFGGDTGELQRWLNENNRQRLSANHLGTEDRIPQLTPQKVLSNGEIWRLTLYKWRYALEASGFNDREVQHLLFHKWLVLHSNTK